VYAVAFVHSTAVYKCTLSYVLITIRLNVRLNYIVRLNYNTSHNRRTLQLGDVLQ
jgi:hypothetical protein